MKQIKRITKIKKDPKNALIVGNAFDEISSYIGLFSTIFVLNSTSDKIRHKSIVYRDTFESLNQLSNVDFIFIDKEFFKEIKNLSVVWRKSKSIILTEGSVFIEKSVQMFLNSENYYAVEVTKHFMIWKLK